MTFRLPSRRDLSRHVGTVTARPTDTLRTSRRTAGVRSPNRSPTARLMPPPLALSLGDVPSAGPPMAAAPPCRHHRWPGRAAVPRPLPVSPVRRRLPQAAACEPFGPASAAGRERLFHSPAVTSSSWPPGKPTKDQKVISNGFGFLGRAPRSRRARPAPGASSPSGPAARAPGHGAPEAGARPRSSRPRPRATGASRERTADTGGVPGRRRRPPSPWLPRGPPARAPRQGRTALDPPPGRRPTATSRTVLPPTQATCAESAAW